MIGAHRPGLRFPGAAPQRWGLVLRQPIDEKDRIDPVDPGACLALDSTKLRAALPGRLPPSRVHPACRSVTRSSATCRSLTGPEVDLGSTNAAGAGCKAKRYSSASNRCTRARQNAQAQRHRQALDQFVIGQEDAKKIVAVAVYSHYRKIERAQARRHRRRQEQRAARSARPAPARR